VSGGGSGDVTIDGIQTLTNKVIDSITNTVGADHIHFKIKATEAIIKGDVLKAVGYNSGENALEVAKVSSASDIAIGICYQNLSSGALGAAINTGTLEGINTSAYTEGTVLYPNTSGGLTSTRPSSGSYQALAYVLRSNTNNGVLLIEATEPVKILSSSDVTTSLGFTPANKAGDTFTGAVTFLDTFNANTIKIGTNKGIGGFSDNAIQIFANNQPAALIGFGGGYSGMRIPADGYFGWSDTNAISSGHGLRLERDADQILAQRNGTNPQTFRLYNTYTDGSNYERAFFRYNTNVLEIGHEAAGTGNADRVIRLTHTNNGKVVTGVAGFAAIKADNAGLYLRGAGQLGWTNGSNADSPADTGVGRDSAGIVKITNGSTGLGSLKASTLDVNGSSVTSTLIGNWNTAYGWGNHASAGYLTSATAASTYAPISTAATLTGTQTLTNKTLTSPAITGGTASGLTLNDGYTEEVFTVSGTTPALSPNNGSIQTWSLTANSTPTQGTWAAGQSITLMIDDGTAYTVTWTSLAVTWKTDGGSAPTLNTTGDTVIALWKVGSTIYGARVGDA
jgi:hypothetical protein